MQESEDSRIRRIVQEELAHHGLRGPEQDDNRDLFRWLRRHKTAFDHAGNWAWRSVVLALVTAITITLWEGLKHILNNGV